LFSPYPGNSEPRSILSDSLDNVDRKQLQWVIMSFLENEDSVVRASIIPVLGRLSDRELAPLLPDIVRAIETLAPTNEMWGDDIRQSGLDILSRRHIREGMLLCVSTIEWRWGLNVQKRMEFLSRYGKNAQEVLPRLRKLVRDLEKNEEGAKPSDSRKALNRAIADIEAAKDAPKLVNLKEFITNASTSDPVRDRSNH
jgi:hypothetical protein